MVQVSPEVSHQLHDSVSIVFQKLSKTACFHLFFPVLKCPKSTQKSSEVEKPPPNAVSMHKRSHQEDLHGDIEGGMCSEPWGKGRETATSTHTITPQFQFFFFFFISIFRGRSMSQKFDICICLSTFPTEISNNRVFLRKKIFKKIDVKSFFKKWF